MPYTELYPVGSLVRVAPRATLESFRREWKLHHPMQAEQLAEAGKLGVVASVGFYHGGDVLYEIKNVTGIWHECCLEAG